jgi:hypothetical protein
VGVKLAVMKSPGVGVTADREYTGRTFNERERRTAYCCISGKTAGEQQE